MSGDTAIKLDGVSKKYCRSLKRSMRYGIADVACEILGIRQTGNLREDEFWAVDDVSFEVRRGECIGIVGPNGAGKSTLLKMINGIFPPDRGSVEIDGSMGALIEVGAGFHPLLSGRENVYINGAILGASKKEIDRKFDEIVDFAELEEFIDSPVKHYSSGMYVRLGFAIAACLAPSIFLLDEVLAVGDAHFRHKCYGHAKTLIREGKAIVLVSHAMTDLLRVTERVVVIDHGRKIFEGPTEEGVAQYQLCMTKQDCDHEDSGSNKVTIKNINILNVNGNVTDRLQTFDDFWLIFDALTEHEIGPCELIFVIESSAYGEITTLSSLSSEIKILPSLEGTHYGLRVHKLPLLTGYYNIHVHCHRIDDGELLGSQYHAAGFCVIGGPLSAPHTHLLTLERDWYEWSSDEEKLIRTARKTPSDSNEPQLRR